MPSPALFVVMSMSVVTSRGVVTSGGGVVGGGVVGTNSEHIPKSMFGAMRTLSMT